MKDCRKKLELFVQKSCKIVEKNKIKVKIYNN